MTLEILTAEELSPIRHGFFTRKGGLSSGIYEGLNCGVGSCDQRDAVIANRRLVADAMGVAKDHLLGVHQVHSADVAHVTAPASGPNPKCDAMVTATKGVALGILTADCQPVLFADVDAQVIGAAHAGWKGALGGVLEATVDAMVTLGAKRSKIAAVIGPSISQRNYEVGAEFMYCFVAEDPEYQQFFSQGARGRPMFDLPRFGLSRLRRAGVNNPRWTGHCTYADAARFYSYRRTTHQQETDYGRLIAAISL